MRMTKNKKQVLEALAYVSCDGSMPPYNARCVQDILKDELGYGDFDLPNLTRTLKALVDQGLVESTIGELFVSGSTGCVESAINITQDRPLYWPADLDLDALRIKYHGSPEERAWRLKNLYNRLCGAPTVTKEEYLNTLGYRERSEGISSETGRLNG
ncbi:hypothetical protein IFT98_02315 [Pseudomonas sp. CFBP 8770]|uniref:hypothetical protein n=1 Tax=unclassified Pseudomonas TaxID=196821 RepID=UPI00177B73F2|nr:MULTISPECIES: hypothetical protein [unclassified Pseudomonas]MBD8473083.1 hypothetical protein [Pseudomonas sp. CFBP 8773]MBD8645814.1 hypothetical protein [Pseudomonas sp. CFBP 8770]